MSTMVVTFNQDVKNNFQLKKVANYLISGPTSPAVILITLLNTYQVRITIDTMKHNGAYTLTLANISNKWGDLIVSPNNAIAFIGKENLPKLVSAIATGDRTIRLLFDASMDKTAVETIGFYSIDGDATIDVSAAVQVLPSIVDLTTVQEMVMGDSYTVWLTQDIVDIGTNKIDTDDDHYDFSGYGTKPRVVSAVSLNDTTIQVTFDENMSAVGLDTHANYNFKTCPPGGAITVGEVTVVDPKTVNITITGEMLTGVVNYTLEVLNLLDTAGNPLDTAHDEATFDGCRKARVLSTTRSGAVVTVVFDQDMSDTGLLTSGNYVLTGDALIQPTLVIAKVNQYTVTATMTGEMKTGVDNYTLTMSNLITLDKGLGINASYNHGHFSGAGVAPTLSGSPVATASPNRILVAFSEAMNEASMLEKSNYSFPTHPTPGDLTISSTTLKDGNEVYLNLSTEMQDDYVYSLLASQSVLDAVGNPVDLAGDEELFVGHGTLPVLSSASKISDDEIDVVFNEAMDETSAETAGSYNVTTLGGANVASAVLDGDTVTVHLTLDKDMGTGTTTVVSSATDLAGNPCTSPDNDASFDSMNWTQITTADEPSGRYGHGAGVISDSSYATYYMIYGGYDGTYPTDTWIYVGDDWDELTPDNDPGQVSMSRLCSFLLGGRESVLMFGGLTNMGVPRDETWAWIPADDDWADLTAFGTPPTARILHAMAYDVDNNEVVLFGGMDAAAALLGDTFTFAEISCAWTDVTPGSDPSPRKGPGMAYDETRNETVLFGGYDATGFVADTWVWNGSTWTQKSPAHSPSARMNHQMWYSAATEKIYILGGSTAGGVVNTIWSWDGSDWTEETTFGTAPTSRYAPYSAIGISPGWDTIMLFGGTTGKLNDTWFL